jgi:phosphoserine aminotransferase
VIGAGGLRNEQIQLRLRPGAPSGERGRRNPEDIEGRGGFSLLELPFSAPEFETIRAGAEADLRALLGLGDDYRVLFLQGGATAMFSLTPMNLLHKGDTADYVATGLWSRRAAEAASRLANVRIAATGDGRSLPRPEDWRVAEGAAFLHLTSTETAEGLQYFAFPDLDGVPIAADMTADFLTRPIWLAPFGLIYASAQKNLGVAGLTIVVLHERLLRRASSEVPGPFSFARQAADRSKVNTPPVFALAVAGKMLRWLRDGGGLEAAAARNARKAETLHAALDAEDFYHCPARAEDRSTVSVRFQLAEARLEARFLREAEDAGLFHLKGHPAVGGLRASLYNGVTQEAVEALVLFLADFARRRS